MRESAREGASDLSTVLSKTHQLFTIFSSRRSCRMGKLLGFLSPGGPIGYLDSLFASIHREFLSFLESSLRITRYSQDNEHLNVSGYGFLNYRRRTHVTTYTASPDAFSFLYFSCVALLAHRPAAGGVQQCAESEPDERER